MPQFMDVHNNMKGLTEEDLKAAHDADIRGAFRGRSEAHS